MAIIERLPLELDQFLAIMRPLSGRSTAVVVERLAAAAKSSTADLSRSGKKSIFNELGYLDYRQQKFSLVRPDVSIENLQRLVDEELARLNKVSKKRAAEQARLDRIDQNSRACWDFIAQHPEIPGLKVPVGNDSPAPYFEVKVPFDKLETVLKILQS